MSQTKRYRRLKSIHYFASQRFRHQRRYGIAYLTESRIQRTAEHKAVRGRVLLGSKWSERG